MSANRFPGACAPAIDQLALILYFFQIVKEQKTANDRKRSNLNRVTPLFFKKSPDLLFGFDISRVDARPNIAWPDNGGG